MPTINPVFSNDEKEIIGYLFSCPGCKQTHVFYTNYPGSKANWTFVNNDLEKPTFTPSLLAYPHKTLAYPHKTFDENKNVVETPRCHFILTEGILHFQGDCTHEFAGQKVPLETIIDEEFP